MILVGGNGFAGEGSLLHAQTRIADQTHVGGHAIAGFQVDAIAGNKIFGGKIL